MASFLAHNHASLKLDREGKLSSVMALKSSLRARECPPEEVVAAVPEVACGGGGDRAVFAEGFSVEDFLDIEGFCEVDKDCADAGDDAAPEPEPGNAELEDKKPSDYHVSSSVVPYELMTLPGHDAEELEWVSRIVDDSLADPPPQPKLPVAAFVASAWLPVEGAASASRTAMRRRPTPAICLPSTEALVPVKGGRTKRSRAPVWSLSGETTMPKSALPSSAATTITSYCVTSSPSFSRVLLPKAAVSSPLFMRSSHHSLDDDTSRRPNKKSKHVERGSKSGGKHGERGRKRKKHHPMALQFAGGGRAYAQAGKHGDRRCSHCGVQKTPQWRAGPEGPKTLCNACGVRYKTGRLLPEYRPACSPTFVSSVHSNYHRKVLEIRCQKEGCRGPVSVPAAADAALLDLAPAVASFKPASGERFY